MGLLGFGPGRPPELGDHEARPQWRDDDEERHLEQEPSPVWSILFSRIGALVTDSGGILSHPAIIAREFGIPAVVATGNATQLLLDGQPVRVDGDAGSVTLVAPPA